MISGSVLPLTLIDLLFWNFNILAERLQTVIFKRPEDFKRYVSLLTNATREGFRAMGTDLAGKKQDNSWLYMQVTA